MMLREVHDTMAHNKNKKRYLEAKQGCIAIERCNSNIKKAVNWSATGGHTFAKRKAISAEAKAKLSALIKFKTRWSEGGKFHGKRKL